MPKLKPRSIEEATVLQHGECYPCYSCQRLRAKAKEVLETAIAREERLPNKKASKKRKRNVNERSKRNFAKILKRGSLCIVFKARRLRASAP